MQFQFYHLYFVLFFALLSIILVQSICSFAVVSMQVLYHSETCPSRHGGLPLTGLHCITIGVRLEILFW